MRIGIVVAMVVFLGASAEAGTRILLMAGAEESAALKVALAGRGTEIAHAPAPAGGLRLDRAANVQRATLEASAAAGVWIEVEPGGAEVCVVSADGKLFRNAPLPIDTGSPRVFAAIAASLLDEVLHPGNLDVEVTVDVKVNGKQVAMAPDPAPPYLPKLVPPGAIAEVAAGPDLVARANRTLIEIGPMLSPFSAGLEVELSFPMSQRLRFGLVGAFNSLFVSPPVGVLVGGFELRRIGRGAVHNDIGLVAGGVFITSDDRAAFAGVRLQRKWEMERSALSLSLVPLVAATDRFVIPGIYSSLRWDLPL